jgi:hypothetical protein
MTEVDPTAIVKSQFDKEINRVDNLCFVLVKSSNKNVLAYSFEETSIINPCWIMYEKVKDDTTTPPPTESLTFLENKLAFGITKSKVDETTYDILLAGYKNIPFRLTFPEGGPREYNILLDGIYYKFVGIYVHQNVGVFTSSIEGISLVYYDKEGNLKSTYLKNSSL